MDRVAGPNSQACVMVVLLNRAFFRSIACLLEIVRAARDADPPLSLIPVRLEGGLPPPQEQWPEDVWEAVRLTDGFVSEEEFATRHEMIELA